MRPIRTHFGVFLFSFLAFPLFSQTQIAGIINQYAKVNGIENCEAKLTVDNPSAFVAGDQVLLIQMKGAVININNSSSFGNIENVGSAGFYEINEVLSVSGNNIYLKFEPLHDYTPANSLQLVTLPTYNMVEVIGNLKAKPWDGETGGVLILDANNLLLQASIEVSGTGFRGAEKQEVVSNCNFLTNADAYFYPAGNWRGSPKGEGIAELLPAKELGRGAQANGGGGGNDHNSGGGGGGNIAAGGVGGEQNVSGFGCDGNFPGWGGKACPPDQARLYLGGGGGAGHFDDTGAGSSGGNGGGIAIIIAQTIEANGFSILANGSKPSVAQGDGAGGGGAGGTILLKSNSIIGALNIEAKGGGGGDVNNTPDRCNGVGGGGSGGRFITNVSNFAQVNLAGGQPGVNNVASSQCSSPSNGGEPGKNGSQSNLGNMAIAQNEIQPVEIIEQPVDVLTCVELQVDINFQVLGNNLSYQWQVNDGTGWQNVPISPNYSGAQSSGLTLLAATSAMDGFQFRCGVFSPCTANFYSDEVALEIIQLPEAAFNALPLGNDSFNFQNTSLNATSFLWDFGDGNTSAETNPTHVYTNQGTYQVTLTSFNNCGQSVVTLAVSTEALPLAHFTADLVAGCNPLTVQFQNQSSGSNLNGFNWEFPGGVPAFSTEENPIVTYDLPGIYPVTLTASSSLGSDTYELPDFIEVHLTPSADFSFSIDENTVQFTNSSTGGSFYHWDFGDGNISQSANPAHEYTNLGVYDVDLTASNPYCGSSISYQVFIEVSVTDAEISDSKIQVSPNPTTDFFMVKLPQDALTLTKMRLMNSMGGTLQTLDFQAANAEVDLTRYAPGIYFVEILNGKHSVIAKVAKL